MTNKRPTGTWWCSPSLTTRETQTKTTVRFHITTVRKVIIQRTRDNKCWWRCGEKTILIHCWWECKLVQPLWKTPWRLLKKLTTEMPFVPAIPLLGVNLKRMTSPSQKDICTSMCSAALFTITKTQLVMGREGSLVCCSPRGREELDTTELNWR